MTKLRSALTYVYHLSLPTGSMNSVLRVDFFNLENITNAFVECAFEPGYNCSIDYGTDPSYTNLVSSHTSSATGQVATINLSQNLQTNTTYFFIVSAETGSQCEKVRGNFSTGECTNCKCGVQSAILFGSLSETGFMHAQ